MGGNGSKYDDDGNSIETLSENSDHSRNNKEYNMSGNLQQTQEESTKISDKISDKIKFPNLKVLDSKEKPLILKFNQDLKKKGYVINFWATWCVPCKEELHDLSLLKSKIKKYNLDVFTISIDKKDYYNYFIYFRSLLRYLK